MIQICQYVKQQEPGEGDVPGACGPSGGRLNEKRGGGVGGGGGGGGSYGE